MKTRPKTKDMSSPKKKKIQLIHQYYTYTGFYSFLWTSIKKALPSIIIAVVVLVTLNYFFPFKGILQYVIDHWSPTAILSVFFASESLLGLIPPEAFIAWAGETSIPFANPWYNLGIIALLSYLGGVTSYIIGRAVLKVPSVHSLIEVKMEKHVANIRKWGGILIIVGALLPLPFSIASIAGGLIRYSFKSYLLVGLFRFLRFAVYGYAIFAML